MIAKTPPPPYYAVLFTTKKSLDMNGYSKMADRMMALAREQSGFLGVESVHDEIGITLSYWKSLEAIKAWKNNAEHRIAQELGRTKWYDSYYLRIAKVERDYEFIR
jgi:heme-degrading monooxygenase HmoA